jgi:hypothetical protein
VELGADGVPQRKDFGRLEVPIAQTPKAERDGQNDDEDGENDEAAGVGPAVKLSDAHRPTQRWVSSLRLLEAEAFSSENSAWAHGGTDEMSRGGFWIGRASATTCTVEKLSIPMVLTNVT